MNRSGQCVDDTRTGHFFFHFGNPSMGRRYLHVYYTFFSRIPFYHASILSWSEFLATDPAVPDSIPGATTLSEK
jgi:hypothetical protein